MESANLVPPDQQFSSGEMATFAPVHGAPLATVLVAEDDPAVRGFIGSILEQAGYQVLLAENGRKALALCKNHAGFINPTFAVGGI